MGWKYLPKIHVFNLVTDEAMFGDRILCISLDHEGSDVISGSIHCMDYKELEETVGDNALGKDQH